jgi:hypothetical protein
MHPLAPIHIHIPFSHTRNMSTGYSPRAVVLHHLPEGETDPARDNVRDALLHWASLMDAATTENGRELVRNFAGYGPALDAAGVGDRLEVAKQNLLAMLRADYLLEAERFCADDLARLCTRYQARLRILTNAMRQADNPNEPFDWMREAP